MKPDEAQKLQNFLCDRLYNSALNNVGYKCNAEDIFVDIAENRIKTWLHDFYNEAHSVGSIDQIIDEEKLNYIREYIVNNIMRESDIMNNEDCRNVVDLPEVIASLYELLHLIVTGEPYEYMFHWANTCGSWVENDLFTEQYDRRCNNEQ